MIYCFLLNFQSTRSSMIKQIIDHRKGKPVYNNNLNLGKTEKNQP